MIPLRDTQPSHSPPAVTAMIIIANVMVFLYQFWLGPDIGTAFIAHYGLVPDRLDTPDMLTSMFLHGGWMHLIGNMCFISCAGSQQRWCT
jgi:membrane associated rhomboid family serine protease